jgi:polysaccharide pyruvyl transferase WcaK-like protein
LPEADKKLGHAILKAKGMDVKPLIGIALRHWQGEERYVKEFALAVERLRAVYDAQIVFIPLQFPADTQVAEKVIDAMKDSENVFVLEKGFSTEEYLAIVSNLNLLIGMRLHALVFAALANIPFMAISYDPKIDRFVKSMEGKVTAAIDKVTARDIVNEAKVLWCQRPKRQIEKINKLREEAALNIIRAVKLLAKDK